MPEMHDNHFHNRNSNCRTLCMKEVLIDDNECTEIVIRKEFPSTVYNTLGKLWNESPVSENVCNV